MAKLEHPGSSLGKKVCSCVYDTIQFLFNYTMDVIVHTQDYTRWSAKFNKCIYCVCWRGVIPPPPPMNFVRYNTPSKYNPLLLTLFLIIIGVMTVNFLSFCRHLYSPMLKAGYSSLQAQVAVFLLSAFFHEVCTLHLYCVFVISLSYCCW